MNERNPIDELNPAMGFIGAGVFGKGLALALAAQGFRVLAVNSRSRASSVSAARSRLRGKSASMVENKRLSPRRPPP